MDSSYSCGVPCNPYTPLLACLFTAKTSAVDPYWWFVVFLPSTILNHFVIQFRVYFFKEKGEKNLLAMWARQQNPPQTLHLLWFISPLWNSLSPSSPPCPLSTPSDLLYGRQQINETMHSLFCKVLFPFSFSPFFWTFQIWGFRIHILKSDFDTLDFWILGF